MTDGVSQSASYGTLARGLRAAGVTMSTVGLGGQVDQALLRNWPRSAAAGTPTPATPRRCRAIFAAAERRTIRPDDVTGQIPVRRHRERPRRTQPAGRAAARHRRAGRHRAEATGHRRHHDTGASPAPAGGQPPVPGARAVAVRAGPGRGVDARRGGGVGRRAGRPAGRVERHGPLAAARRPGARADATAARRLSGWCGDGRRPAGQRRRDDHGPALPATVTPRAGQAAQNHARRGRPRPFRRDAARRRPWRLPGRRLAQGHGSGPAGVVTDVAVGYLREYLPGPGGTALLAEVAAVTGGRVLDDPATAAAWEAARNAPANWPCGGRWRCSPCRLPDKRLAEPAATRPHRPLRPCWHPRPTGTGRLLTALSPASRTRAAHRLSGLPPRRLRPPSSWPVCRECRNSRAGHFRLSRGCCGAGPSRQAAGRVRRWWHVAVMACAGSPSGTPRWSQPRY